MSHASPNEKEQVMSSESKKHVAAAYARFLHNEQEMSRSMRVLVEDANDGESKIYFAFFKGFGEGFIELLSQVESHGIKYVAEHAETFAANIAADVVESIATQLKQE